jgi:hypothetical protein
MHGRSFSRQFGCQTLASLLRIAALCCALAFATVGCNSANASAGGGSKLVVGKSCRILAGGGSWGFIPTKDLGSGWWEGQMDGAAHVIVNLNAVYAIQF